MPATWVYKIYSSHSQIKQDKTQNYHALNCQQMDSILHITMFQQDSLYIRMAVYISTIALHQYHMGEQLLNQHFWQYQQIRTNAALAPSYGRYSARRRHLGSSWMACVYHHLKNCHQIHPELGSQSSYNISSLHPH